MGWIILILTILLVMLKLGGVITWAWWIVFAPLIAGLIGWLIVAAMALGLIVAVTKR